MKCRFGREGKEGASLIEALFAIVVLSTMIGGACQIALKSKVLADSARSHYQAVSISKNLLERARVLPFDQLDLCERSAVLVDYAGTPDPDGRFRLTVNVTPLGSDLKELHVLVEILDRTTLRFEGDREEVRSCIAYFQTEVE